MSPVGPARAFRRGLTVSRTVLLAAAMFVLCGSSSAQQTDEPKPQAAPSMVRLNFPESIEVKVLAEYVSERLGLNVIYDEQVGSKRVVLKSPVEVPRDSLLGLLASVLKMKGLVLIDAESPGWKKIVPGGDLRAVTSDIRADGGEGPPDKPAEAVTQVVRLRHATPQSVEGVLKPFLTQPGANTLAVPEQSLLILTDYASNLPRLMRLIELTDRPGPPVKVEFLAVRHGEAGLLAQEVSSVLREQGKALGDARQASPPLPTLLPLERTGQIVLIGTAEQVAQAADLAGRLDLPPEVQTEVHQFQAVSPRRIERIAKELVDPRTVQRGCRWSADEEAGLLIVTAPAAVHEQIRSLARSLDVPRPDRAKSPLRFYKLMNTTALEVLATVQSLQRGKGGLAGIELAGDRSGDGKHGPPGPAQPAADAGQPAPSTRDSAAPTIAGESFRNPPTVLTADAVVTADVNTNTIIVVAPPDVHAVYQELIAMLDKRRPQVLVEVILVTLDTSGGFSLGVEVMRKGSADDGRYLLFSSFGLSAVDPLAGSLALKPGVGFNGALISPDTVDVVVKALSSSGLAKVVAAPKVLVNDNATGTLSSVAEAPFTSVNASDTVATTSFAGYASAGTTITVSPHISEGDHLHMAFSLTLNSFTGEGANGIPPPRQTNTISSEVTVPDGYAVVVGGLNRRDASRTVARVPWLGEWPVLEYLLGNRSDNDSRSTLFAFIRPVILRDDDFEDLKHLSERDLKAAELPGHYPASRAMVME